MLGHAFSFRHRDAEGDGRMMSAISGWILRLVGAALISSAALTLAPEGAAKRAVRLACGLMSAAALMSAVLSFDYSEFSKEAARYRQELGESAALGEEKAEVRTRFIIESKLNEYILDKAEELGLSDLSVSCRCEWGDEGFWYPTGVEIIGNAPEKAKERLKTYIEAELGIPKERQIWSTGDENQN